jgi:hypothetical protein
LKEIIRESQDLEQEIWDAVLQGLSEEQERLIREQFVVSVDGIAGAPVLLMMALTTR